jgi:hypothetical protein
MPLAASFCNACEGNGKIKQQKQVNKTRQSHKTKVNHVQDKTQTSSHRSSTIFWASALPKLTQKELIKFLIDLRKVGEVTPRSDGPLSFSFLIIFVWSSSRQHLHIVGGAGQGTKVGCTSNKSGELLHMCLQPRKKAESSGPFCHVGHAPTKLP